MILTKDEQVYHRISTEMPDVDGRQKLLPFAGKLVKVTGRIERWFQRDFAGADRKGEAVKRGGNAFCAIRLEEAP